MTQKRINLIWTSSGVTYTEYGLFPHEAEELKAELAHMGITAREVD